MIFWLLCHLSTNWQSPVPFRTPSAGAIYREDRIFERGEFFTIALRSRTSPYPFLFFKINWLSFTRSCSKISKLLMDMYPWMILDPPNIYSRVCLDLTRWNKAYKQPGLTEYVPYSVTAPMRSLWDAESYTSEEEYLFSSLYWRRLGWDKAMKEKNGRKQIVRNKAPLRTRGTCWRKTPALASISAGLFSTYRFSLRLFNLLPHWKMILVCKDEDQTGRMDEHQQHVGSKARLSARLRLGCRKQRCPEHVI